MEVFSEISLILLIAFVVSTAMRFFKQPLIIGYILTGLIVGPNFLGIMQSTEVVELFSKLGITALLFIVGLGLSPKVLKELGVVSLLIGLGQVILTSLFGFMLGRLLGYNTLSAVYIAVALTFSSTIIILKVLSDKGDLGKLYGRIAIGYLLVQDLVATVIMVIISSVTTATSNANVVFSLSGALLRGVVLLAVLVIISHYLLPRLTNFIGNSSEYLFVSSLAWGLGVAAMYQYLGLSIEIGALVAGVTLSITPYALEVSSKLKSLRDFFIILFFILLGFQMNFDNWQHQLLPTAVFSFFILVGNPIIVFLLVNLLGYTKKTAFMTGLTVAQISEFSLILITLGFKVGHVSQDILSIVTMTGIITIAGSTYMMLYSEGLFKKLRRILGYLEIRKIHSKKRESIISYEAILFGYRRAGPEFAHVFREKRFNYLVVDFNPDTIQKLEKLGVQADYGDASDYDFLQELPLSDAKLFVSTIPDHQTNLLLSQTIRQVNKEAVILIIADTMANADDLYSAGVTHVIMSHYIGAHYAAELVLEYGLDRAKYEAKRNHQIKYVSRYHDFVV